MFGKKYFIFSNKLKDIFEFSRYRKGCEITHQILNTSLKIINMLFEHKLIFSLFIFRVKIN